MSDHRRTVTRKALVLPGWVMLLVAALVLAGTGWLGWLVVTGDDDAAPAASPSPTATATSEPAPTPTPTPTPTQTTPSPEPTETEETAEPEVDRSSIAVSVLNASRTTGLARTASQRVQAAGWTVGAVGNWRGYVPATTVFHPAGREAEARQLAEDLGVTAVSPAQSGMSAQRLTVVLVGPLPQG